MVNAGQLMRHSLITIAAGESVARAVHTMKINAVSSLIVPPRFEGQAYGILTKHDVVARCVAAGRDPHRMLVSEAMSSPLVSVAPDCPARRCAGLMRRHRIRRLPVVVKDEPVGIVSATDVFDALLRLQPEAAADASD